LSVLAVFGSAIGALAASFWSAKQTGFRQRGGGRGATLTIRVEGALADPASDLLPDPFAPAAPFPCTAGTTSTAISTPTCPGGALNFTIQNTSDVPLSVVRIEAAVPPTPATIFSSDKFTSGTFAPDQISGDCKFVARYQAPDIVDANGGHSNASTGVPPISNNQINSRPWPIIPPHGTLAVNGTDANQLGLGMIHLDSFAANGCQGATFSTSLIVTAQDATATPA
jgi:hypothetical protein